MNRFKEVLEFLDSSANQEREPTGSYHLGRVRRLVARLGHPERALPVIHVAGTKGKGSVCLMLEAILEAHGFRTGVYTSPHLRDVRERIRRRGRSVTRAEFAEAVRRAIRAGVRGATYFELLTAAALDDFARHRVEAAVIEVGIGGRLDATNVVVPKVCVINTIGLDHTDRLGRTRAAIASEKAGILKPGAVCVMGPQPGDAARVIRREGARVGCLVFEPHIDFRWRARKIARNLFTHVWTSRGRFAFDMPFAGFHQAANAAVALQAAEGFGVELRPARVARAFRRLRLPGRLDLRGRFLFDVAHNPLAVGRLVQSLRAIHAPKMDVIFGCARDKDARTMIRLLKPFTKRWILTRADWPRSAPPDLLRRWTGTAPALITDSVPDAVAASRGATLVTGSFYVVGEAMAVREA